MQKKRIKDKNPTTMTKFKKKYQYPFNLIFLLLPLLITQTLQKNQPPPSPAPEKTLPYTQERYIAEIDLQLKNEKNNFLKKKARYFFSSTNSTGCSYTFTFLEEKKILSSGYTLQLKSDQEASHLLYGLKNEKVYKAYFIEFPQYFFPSKNSSFDVQVFYKEADFKKGFYKNLVIKSVDPGFENFELRVKKLEEFVYLDFFLFVFIPGFVFLNFESIKSMFKNTHFTVNFNYKFSSVSVFFSSVYYVFFVNNSMCLLMISTLEFIALLLGMIVLDWKKFLSFKLLKTLKKNFFFTLISILACFFLTFFKDYFPFVYTIPMLMFLVDLKSSKDSQKASRVVTINMIKCAFLLCDFYLPSTITKIAGNPMVEIATPGIYYYTGIAIIMIPASVVFLSRKKPPKGLIKLRKELKPDAKFLHGKKGKKDGRCILEAMKENIPDFDIGFFDVKMGADKGVILKVFRPFQLLGVYSTSEFFIKGGRYDRKNKECLSYYKYRKSGYNKKPDFLFRVVDKEFARNLRTGIRLLEVNFFSSGNKNKLFSLNLGTRERAYSPRSRKILLQNRYLSLSKDVNLAAPEMLNSKQRLAFIINGRIEYLILKPAFSRAFVNNHNAELNTLFYIGKDPAISYCFLKSGSDDLNFKALPLSRYSLEHSMHSVVEVLNFGLVFCFCFKITENYSIAFYELEKDENENFELKYRYDVDRNFFEGERFRGMTLVGEYRICVILDSSLLLINFENLNFVRNFKIEIENFGYGIRNYEFDFSTKRLYFYFGRRLGFFMVFMKKMSVAGFYDLSDVLEAIEIGREVKIGVSSMLRLGRDTVESQLLQENFLDESMMSVDYGSFHEGSRGDSGY